jgi:hypothetical protein
MEALAIDTRLFEPIRVNEERLENLLRTSAPAVFSGFDYFEFKPAIRCRDGLRHPDGVLLSADSNEWWVVEVETHQHHLEEHIEPQLSDLMAGMYGPEAFAYLERHARFDRSRYDVDPYEPSFLLIIDSVTHEIESLATRLGIPVAECSVYFSGENNQFALALTGFRPQTGESREPGLSLVLQEREGMAVLLPADGRKMPMLKAPEILIGSEAFPWFKVSEWEGIVLPLKRSEVEAAISCSPRYKLVTKTMRLIADPEPSRK